VSPWKVILATLVIFCSGLAVGALMVKKYSRPGSHSRAAAVSANPNPSLSPSHLLQKEFLRRMHNELTLDTEQRQRIEKILKESQERTKEIREKIAPEMKEEVKKVREQIRAELTPEQQPKFDALIKAKPRKPDEQGGESSRKIFPKDGFRRQQTNAPVTNSVQPANP
jgi:Spy/CpxP family protein refolding chaperone